jgi:Cu(I)/Ag(I) efflux system membrane fusion protein
VTASPRSSTLRVLAVVAVVVLAFVAGFLMRGTRSVDPSLERESHDAHETAAHAQTWTCAMHTQIHLPEPGPCPICGMDLVPVKAAGETGSDDRTMVFSETARRLAQVRTVPVERRLATVAVRMVGKVDYDETRTGTITAYVPGRLERLFIDYTGLRVKRGDHMVTIYSPELIAAQEELLQAIASARTLERSELEIMRRTAADTVSAARERLRLWGLLPEQIAEVEARRSVQEVITLYSPMSGVVIDKNAMQGQYVETGSRIYTIADLEHLWVRLDAYESDIEWVRLGQQVEFTTEAYPGTVFRGRISFIDPVLDGRTRTVKLRVNVPNEDGRLKPGMLVRAEVKSRVAGVGRVFDPYLAGKWISPMHPEIVKDRPGSCDICGMDLVPAESLGYVRGEESAEAPLVIPISAPLITGKRAVVYVEQPDTDSPTYVGREVVLGPKAGDVFIVRSGLAEGERVVVEGNFKIDSALQIEARPSMMSPQAEPADPAHDHERDHPSPEGSSGALDPVFRAYLDLQAALAADDAAAARTALKRLSRAQTMMNEAELSSAAAARWRSARAQLHGATVAAENARDISATRLAFHDLSDIVIELVRQLGHGLGDHLVVAHCPMAFEEGADWLQVGEQIENPYFGEAMFRCGEIRELLPATGAAGH